MKKTTMALALMIGSSACVQHHAVDPSGVAVERALGAGYMETYTLRGVGWSCSGSVRASQYERVSVRSVPLACTDGATGTAQITYASSNRAMQVNTTVLVSYRLSDGRSGEVRV